MQQDADRESLQAELAQCYERERAMRDILDVIRQSRDDESPVFETVLRNARQLCGADTAALMLGRPDDAHLTLAALSHADPARQATVPERLVLINETPMEMDPKVHISAAAICTAAPVNVADLKETDGYRTGELSFRMMVEKQGHRSILSVPLLDARGALGAINLHRSEPGVFTKDEVALVQTFAAQAAIAIENVRQFRQVEERLAREIASRDVLQAISASRSDPAPVFDVILKNAARLSDAPSANLCIVDASGTHWKLRAHFGEGLRYLSVDGPPRPLDSQLVPAVAMRTAKMVHVPDLTDTDLYRQRDPGRVAMVEEEGMRTILGVPLMLNDGAVGCITLFRREVKAFTPDEIALVETFAAQAVIAIENVRQFREVQTRLEREAATREILQVISQSRDDEQPVFDMILQKASHLCNVPDAALMLLTASGTRFRIRAHRGTARLDLAVTRDWGVDEPLPIAQCFREARTIHIDNMLKSAPYLAADPTYVRMVDDEGLRTRLCVPLLRQGAAFGVIALSRYEVAPFTKDEIGLIETFAEQAVIAIENVRQFRQVQERLTREQALRDILTVISRCRDNEKPVFDAILHNARLLCDASDAALLIGRPDEAHLTLAALLREDAPLPADNEAVIAETNRVPMRMDPAIHTSAEAICSGKIVHIHDLSQSAGYRAGEPSFKSMVDDFGLLTCLSVPLFDSRGALGAINLHRRTPRLFNDDEIALIEAFAAQAVIAIENVRQFKALETLNAELGERVTEQVGEIERMGKLKRFLPAAVADTVVSSGSENMLKSHRALLGVLFCDIRGFTAFCETAEPEETIEVLQTYHEEMGKLINAHRAGVDHRMGDGIMVLFNDPIPCDDPAGDAVRLAIAMRARMAELGRDWKRMGFRLGFGVGVSLGYATVGMVGYEGRSDYTASGTAINVASRLCEMAEDGEILLSTRAAIAVEDDFPSASTGEVTLKGIREPVEVFRLT